MESVAEVPEEASRLSQPRFWIRVVLLLDRLPAKANEPCLPCPTDRQTDRQTDRTKNITSFFGGGNKTTYIKVSTILQTKATA